MAVIPLWAYIVSGVFYALFLIRRARLRRQNRIVNVTEGYHRPMKRVRF